MTLIEGIGDEVVCYFILAVILKLCVYFYFRYRNLREELELEEQEQTNNANAPPVHNPHTCPICWNDQTLGLETNCGHLYCVNEMTLLLLTGALGITDIGLSSTMMSIFLLLVFEQGKREIFSVIDQGLCLSAYYDRSIEAIRNGINCPMCRQQVNLLFVCFTQDEREADRNSEIGRSRRQVLSFAVNYNRSFSAGPRSMLDQIREIPTLLRHLIRDLSSGEADDEYATMRLRYLWMGFFTVAYFFVPTDIFPEHAFGFLGLLDDILITLFTVFYATASYRRFAANRNFFGDEDF